MPRSAITVEHIRAREVHENLAANPDDTVNLSAVVSGLTGQGGWRIYIMAAMLLIHHGGNAADFCPDPECLRPGGSVLGGGEMITAEVKKAVDLIAG